MSDKDYTHELAKARQTLVEFLREREEIEVKIARQKKRVAAWAELCNGKEPSEDGGWIAELAGSGLTEVCVTAMRASRKEWMTIAEIQETVKELGFPLRQYKAPAASITTTVNRLVEDGVVVMEKRPRLGNEYKWVGPVVPPMNALARVARIGQQETHKK